MNLEVKGMINNTRIPGSFRDPSGFIFTHNGEYYRQIEECYADKYRHLIDSGLYNELVDRGLLIPHVELSDIESGPGCYCIIKPRQLQFISYPYEWCMSQLRDAALVTLDIQETALSYGMCLKDASAYNIQFVDGHPMLIDTLSFDTYNQSEPWIAYRQFCRHFIAPLAIMKHVDLKAGAILRLHLDGIPLDLASEMLPFKTNFYPAILLHIHIHSKFQKKYAETSGPEVDTIKKRTFSENAMKDLIRGLKDAVRSITFPKRKYEWTDYYDFSNYTDASFKAKEQLVNEYLCEISPNTLWDLGANDGRFSYLASSRNIHTVAIDNDPTVVERCYVKAKQDGNKYLHPLLIDLTNPSPDLGWAHTERLSFMGRGPVDAVMALALIHHLAIGNNVPFDDIAVFLAGCGRYLIIEYVPKSDSKVRQMLSTREDIFTRYTREGFEEDFGRHFVIKRSDKLPESERILYLMEKRQ